MLKNYPPTREEVTYGIVDRRGELGRLDFDGLIGAQLQQPLAASRIEQRDTSVPAEYWGRLPLESAFPFNFTSVRLYE